MYTPLTAPGACHDEAAHSATPPRYHAPPGFPYATARQPRRSLDAGLTPDQKCRTKGLHQARRGPEAGVCVCVGAWMRVFLCVSVLFFGGGTFIASSLSNFLTCLITRSCGFLTTSNPPTACQAASRQSKHGELSSQLQWPSSGAWTARTHLPGQALSNPGAARACDNLPVSRRQPQAFRLLDSQPRSS